MRILLVDDEPLELEQLRYLIKEKYPLWEIKEAEDGVVAKRLLADHHFDLALIDIHLPGENGLNLCAYIKENYQTECMMITAYQEFAYARQSIKLQVMDYLTKPVIARELYQALEHFILHFGRTELSPEIHKVMDYIQHHFSKKLNLQELASFIHVSPSYLSRKFTEETGKNFQEFVVELRLKKAKEMIKQNPFLSMGMIAEKTGFSSQNHFSTAFKKYEGVSPSVYKEKEKNA
ncbi:response regulator [Bacillus sp. V5-8f]|uniref:response regulator transcription factor n=1 Tax=Bacillus sp. V5-8f TaxID=2053044 RepID=UPI000C767567|nr:response regulator [Bacillus sp. V5-8f]PLT35516.1 DNA-binding response regulator [Bacillus sp. V5-8f]